MNRKVIVIFMSVFFLLGFSSFAEAQFSYSGTIYLDNGLTAAADSDWEVGPTILTWSVDWNGSDPYVSYSYTLETPGHAPSYFILETSDTFNIDDIFNISGGDAELGTWIPDPDDYGGQYQTMPESVYGIKFDNLSGENTITISFDSTRLPEWGDFYSRCGVREEHQDGIREWNSAWNTGFTVNDTDPTGPADNGSLQYSILVPNSLVVVPEPISTVLFITGAGILGGRRLIKRKK